MTRIGGAIFDALIRIWLRMFGRRVDVTTHRWIGGAVGAGTRIGPEVYDDVARQMALHREMREPAGLMRSFDALAGPGFDPSLVRHEVRDFYERTSEYEIDAWASWSRTFRPLAKILVGLISRRVDQLNLPVGAFDTAAGIQSEVIPLVDPDSGELRAAGWLRRVQSSGAVIYAGIYELIELGSRGQGRQDRVPASTRECGRGAGARTVDRRVVPIGVERPTVRRSRHVPNADRRRW
jgi:hypothetical protein